MSAGQSLKKKITEIDIDRLKDEVDINHQIAIRKEQQRKMDVKRELQRTDREKLKLLLTPDPTDEESAKIERVIEDE
jgi:hypothetical protein